MIPVIKPNTSSLTSNEIDLIKNSRYIRLYDHMPHIPDIRINMDNIPCYEKNTYRELFLKIGVDTKDKIFVTNAYTKFEGLENVIIDPDNYYFIQEAHRFMNYFPSYNEIPNISATKKFTFMSNKPRGDRMLMSKVFANLFNCADIEYSYIPNNTQEIVVDELLIDTDYIFKNIFLEEKWFHTDVNEKKTSLGIIYDNNRSVYENIKDLLFYQSATSIISESSFYEFGNMFTEKTIMSIYSGHFLIWPGNYKAARTFKKLGFDVFDDIIDHSHEDIRHPGKRVVEAILRNIEFLNDIQLQKFYRDKFKDRLMHNLNLVRHISKLKENISNIQVGSCACVVDLPCV